MEETFRKTFRLASAHARLLVPLIVASLLAGGLLIFQKAATHYMLHHWLIGQTFLGIYVPQPDPAHFFVHQAMIVILPFTLCMRMLIFTAYTVGFVFTAQLVRELCVEQAPCWKRALENLAKLSWRIPAFAAVVMLLYVSFTSAISLVTEQKELAFFRGAFAVRARVDLTIALACALTAWILLPAALRLIGDGCRSSPAPKQRQQAWLATMATVAMVLLASHLTDEATRLAYLALPNATAVRAYVVNPALSLLLDLPLGLLWIFLAVLKNEGPETSEVSSPS